MSRKVWRSPSMGILPAQSTGASAHALPVHDKFHVLNHPDEKQRQSRWKRVCFALITFLIVWLITDTLAYVVLRYLGESKSVFFRIRPATSDEQISRWYKGLSFHPRWGYDISEDLQGQLGNRKGREYERKDQFQIKVFGDSFAFGAGMKESETFEYLIEEKTGWACLNYGVVGFGTDQALLKYIDNRIKTRYTVLTILDENIERCLTMCRGLLTGTIGLTPKPRFVIKPNGSITLLENPLRNVSELEKLKDASFLESLKEHDYWAKYYEKLNAPSELKWPATLTLVSHFDYFVRVTAKQAKYIMIPTYESHYSRWPHNHLYEEGSEGLRIMKYIINQFVATAAERNEIPIVLLFPKRETMEIIQSYRKKPYQSLVNFLEAEDFSFIDFGDVFVDKTWLEYYIRDGHYSRAGNHVIADELVRFIQRFDEQSKAN